jgi:prevent-host-death family protein
LKRPGTIERGYNEVVTTLPLSEASSRLSELSDEVSRTHERVFVTKDGGEDVVLISAAELESIEATLELLQDSDALAEVREGEDAIQRGDVTTEPEMTDLMEARRHRAGTR